MVSEQNSFEFKVFGKWILVGEHSVLRGHPALVFPVYGRSFRITASKSTSPLKVEFGGSRGEEIQVLFSGIIDKALKALGKNRSDIEGLISIQNEIPVGAGMGASAALCVAVSKFLQWYGLLEEKELYEFSRSLEDTFHGESSGVDIAVALSGNGLEFSRSGLRNDVHPKWEPFWYLSYSGQRGLTHECVAQVKKNLSENPKAGEALDLKMAKSVELAKEALLQEKSPESFELLKNAIDEAGECFKAWGLADGQVEKHINSLQAAGAVACKPTGSGNGGFVLSLWDQPPQGEILSELISLNK